MLAELAIFRIATASLQTCRHGDSDPATEHAEIIPAAITANRKLVGEHRETIDINAQRSVAMSKSTEFDAFFADFEAAFKRTASIVRKIKKESNWRVRAALMKELKQSDVELLETRKKLESVYGSD